MTARLDIDSQRAQRTLDSLSYRGFLGDHYMTMTFRAYTYAATDGLISANRSTSADISLPLPSNITDAQGVQIGQTELGAMGATVADLASSGGRDNLLNDIRAASSTIKDSFDSGQLGGAVEASSLVQSVRAAAAFAGRNALDMVGAGGVATGLDVGTGTAINPHMALKFDGVTLKNHNFEWTLSPRNETEANTLRQIIYKIKQQMLPEYTTNGDSALSRSLLNYPSLVDIRFIGLNEDHYFKFKPCLINSFTANYSSNGNAINKGGKPSVVTISLQVTEARIHTREDYR